MKSRSAFSGFAIAFGHIMKQYAVVCRASMNTICNGVTDSSKLCEPLTKTVVADCSADKPIGYSSQIAKGEVCLPTEKNAGHPQTFCDAFSEFLICNNKVKCKTAQQKKVASKCSSNILGQKQKHHFGRQREAVYLSKAGTVSDGSDVEMKMINSWMTKGNPLPDEDNSGFSSVKEHTEAKVPEDSHAGIIKSKNPSSLINAGKQSAAERDRDYVGCVVKNTDALGSNTVDGEMRQLLTEKLLDSDYQRDLPSEKLSTVVCIKEDDQVKIKDEKDSLLTESRDSGICDVEITSNHRIIADNLPSLTSVAEDDLAKVSVERQSACGGAVPSVSRGASDDLNSHSGVKDLVTVSAKAADLCGDSDFEDRAGCAAAADTFKMLESCCRPVRVVLRRLSADVIDAFSSVKHDSLEAPNADVSVLQKTPRKKEPALSFKSRQPKLPKSDAKKRKPKQPPYMKDDLVESITLDLITWLPQLADEAAIARRSSGACKRKYDSFALDESLDNTTPYVPNFMTHSDFPLKGCSLAEKWKRVCELERDWFQDDERFSGLDSVVKTPVSSISSIGCSGTNRALVSVSGPINATVVTPLGLLQKSPKPAISEEIKRKCKVKKKSLCRIVSVAQNQVLVNKIDPSVRTTMSLAGSESIDDANKMPDHQNIANADQQKSRSVSSESNNLPSNCPTNGKMSADFVQASGKPECYESNRANVDGTTNVSGVLDKTLLKSAVGICLSPGQEPKLLMPQRMSLSQACLSTSSTAETKPTLAVIAGCGSYSQVCSKELRNNSGIETLSAKVPPSVADVLCVRSGISSSYTRIPLSSVGHTSGSRTPLIISRVRVSIPSSQPAIGSSTASSSSTAVRICPSVIRSSLSVSSSVSVFPSAARSLLSVSPRPKLLKYDVIPRFGNRSSSISSIQTGANNNTSCATSSTVPVIGTVIPTVEVRPTCTPSVTACRNVNDLSSPVSSVGIKYDNPACHRTGVTRNSGVVQRASALKSFASMTDVRNKCIGAQDSRTVFLGSGVLTDLAKPKISESAGMTLSSGSILLRVSPATLAHSYSKTAKQNECTVTSAGTGTVLRTSCDGLAEDLKSEREAQHSVGLSAAPSFDADKTPLDCCEQDCCNQDMSSWLAASMGLYTCICGAAFSDGWSCHQHQVKCPATSLS